MVEEGGGGSGAATPIAAEVLKAAVDSMNGTLNLDDVQFVAGSIGKSVKIKADSQRTD